MPVHRHFRAPLAIAATLFARSVTAQPPTLAAQLAPPPCRITSPDSLPAGTLVPSPCIGRTVRVHYSGGRDRESVGRLERFDTSGLVLVRRGTFSMIRDSVPVAVVREVEVLAASRATKRMLIGGAAGLLAGAVIGGTAASGGRCAFELGSLCSAAGGVAGGLLGTLGGMLIGSSFPERVWRPIWRGPTATSG